MKQKEAIAYLKFPHKYDEKRLLSELSTVFEDKWKTHFNTQNYSGEWNTLSLYAPNGDPENIFINPVNDALPEETPLLKECHYLKEIIDSFQFPILSARLLRLRAGAYIHPHSDHKLSYEDNEFRLHIPIITNDQVKFILNGTRLNMLPGELWYTNVNYTHSVANESNEDRIHLVIDGMRNENSDRLFFSEAPEESFISPPEEYSPEVMQQMINSLKDNDTPAAKQIIHELEEKLKNIS